MVICGAGISTSSGIPDFRSPESGLYETTPDAETIFDSELFADDPTIFYEFARANLFPALENSVPSKTHQFLASISDKLLRVYTQNVDGLESVAGLPAEKTVFVHGSLKKATCLSCKKAVQVEDPCWWRPTTKDGDLVPRCLDCDGVLRPEMLFFGDRVSDAVARRFQRDLAGATMVVCIGTSLSVEPLASLVMHGKDQMVPYVWINRLAYKPRKQHSARFFEFVMLGETDDVVTKLQSTIDSLPAIMRPQCGTGVDKSRSFSQVMKFPSDE